MTRPRAFYYEDYDTKSDPEWLYHKSEADREFGRLEEQVTNLRTQLTTASDALKQRDEEIRGLRAKVNSLVGGEGGNTSPMVVRAALKDAFEKTQKIVKEEMKCLNCRREVIARNGDPNDLIHAAFTVKKGKKVFNIDAYYTCLVPNKDIKSKFMLGNSRCETTKYESQRNFSGSVMVRVKEPK
jgi:hypothetical protein